MAIACSTSVGSDDSLDAVLGKIAGMGFKHVDLLAMDGWAHVSPQDLADRWEETLVAVDGPFRKHGLTPVALNANPSPALDARDAKSNARRTAETKALIRLMKRYGIKVASLQPKCGDRSLPWEKILRASAETLREQVALGRSEGVSFGVEMHQGSPFEKTDQARRLLDAVPDLVVIYDPSHLVMQAIDIKENAWLLDRTAHVHLRDAAPNAMCVEFGKGLVDIGWVLDEIKRRKYRGHIALEYLASGEYDVLDSTRRLFEFVKARFA